MDYQTHFNRYGYVVVPGVLSNAEISTLRSFLDQQWRTLRHNSKRMLSPMDNLEHADIYMASLRPKVVEALKQVLGPDYSMLPDFQVQRNMFGFPGWHTDAGSEGFAPYLMDRNYRFVKCGIYLQGNDPRWGGGIDIVPGGHRFPLRLPSVKASFRIKNLWNRIGQKFFKLRVRSNPGDFIFFDSRLPHCSSLPSDLTGLRIANNVIENMPAANTKYVIYWDSSATDKLLPLFLKNAQQRAEEELRNRAKEPYFLNYAQLKFPEDFPQDFVDGVSKAGIRIASLSPSEVASWKSRFQADFKRAS